MAVLGATRHRSRYGGGDDRVGGQEADEPGDSVGPTSPRNRTAARTPLATPTPSVAAPAGTWHVERRGDKRHPRSLRDSAVGHPIPFAYPVRRSPSSAALGSHGAPKRNRSGAVPSNDSHEPGDRDRQNIPRSQQGKQRQPAERAARGAEDRLTRRRRPCIARAARATTATPGRRSRAAAARRAPTRRGVRPERDTPPR
jgi:hypothetical protein